MKLTIVAATGGIGRQLLEQAMAAGHEVTAVVRNPDTMPAGVRVVKADLMAVSSTVLEPAVAGADAVLSGLGPRPFGDIGVVEHGTRVLVDAMHTTGARRIVIVTAAPIGTMPSPSRPNPPRHDPGDGFLMRHVLSRLARAALHKRYVDLVLAEDVLSGSGLEWTIVRPPRLTDKPVTGSYRTAYGRNVRGGSAISRADLAHYMLHATEQREAIGEIVGIAY